MAVHVVIGLDVCKLRNAQHLSSYGPMVWPVLSGPRQRQRAAVRRLFCVKYTLSYTACFWYIMHGK